MTDPRPFNTRHWTVRSCGVLKPIMRYITCVGSEKPLSPVVYEPDEVAFFEHVVKVHNASLKPPALNLVLHTHMTKCPACENITIETRPDPSRTVVGSRLGESRVIPVDPISSGGVGSKTHPWTISCFTALRFTTQEDAAEALAGMKLIEAMSNRDWSKALEPVVHIQNDTCVPFSHDLLKDGVIVRLRDGTIAGPLRWRGDPKSGNEYWPWAFGGEADPKTLYWTPDGTACYNTGPQPKDIVEVYLK